MSSDTHDTDDSTESNERLLTRREALSGLGVGVATAVGLNATTQPAMAQSMDEPRIQLGDDYTIDDSDGDLVLEHTPSGAQFTYDESAGQWTVGSISTEDLHSDRTTIRFDPDTDDLQSVLDSAPQHSRIVGHKETVVELAAEASIETDDIVLETLNLKVADGADDNAIGVRADDVTVRDVHVDGNRDNQSETYARGIFVRGDLSGVLIENCRVHSVMGHGIDFDPTGSDRITESSIVGCYAWNNADDGVTIHNSDHVEIERTFSWNNEGPLGTSSGYEVEGDCHDITLRGCHAFDNTEGSVGVGFNIVSDDDGNPYSIVLEGCHADGNNRNFRASADDGSPNTPQGAELIGCHGTNPQTVSNVELVGYDVTINGGYYPDQWIRLRENNRHATVALIGHGRDGGDGAEGEIKVEQEDINVYIDGWHSTTIVFEADPATARINDWHATDFPREISAEDDATVTDIVVTNSDFVNGFSTDGSSASFVRNVLDGRGFNAGDPNSTGDWNGEASRAEELNAVIEDTSNNDLYMAVDGSFAQIDATP